MTHRIDLFCMAVSVLKVAWDNFLKKSTNVQYQQREDQAGYCFTVCICTNRLWLHLYAGPKTKLLIALREPEALAVWCCAYKLFPVCLVQKYIIHTKLITCGCPGLVNAKSTGWCRHLCRPGCDSPINISGITGGFEPLFRLLMLQKAKWSLISSSQPCASGAGWEAVGLTLERTAFGGSTCKPWNLWPSKAQSLTPLFSDDLSRIRTLDGWPADRVPLTCLLPSYCDLSVLMFFQCCKFPLVLDAS